MFRGLDYLHSLNIVHRDIKPNNLLIDPSKGVLKISDFGSAKELVPDQPSICYIGSRHYRAPELLLGATGYTTSIDIWAAGCVLAEMLLGKPLFAGDSSIEQLVRVIKILGTPSKQEIHSMNPKYEEFRFPTVHATPLPKIFRKKTPTEALDLLFSVLIYSPQGRPTAKALLSHPFFHGVDH